MQLTKAFVWDWDGYQGQIVDYLDNYIPFNLNNVSPSLVPTLSPGLPILIEDEGNTMYVTTAEESFDRWQEELFELFTSNTLEVA